MKIVYGEDLANELRNRSDGIKERLWIAVPYIGGIKSVRKIIGKIWMENSKLDIRLISDTDEFNNFNSETIKLFIGCGKIRHLAGLHAKIFITDNKCLITSANLTEKAFSRRHEIGIFLDTIDSRKAISIFKIWWKKSEEVHKLKPLISIPHKSVEERGGSKLPVIWNLPEDPGTKNYWLKPIGTSEDPIQEGRAFAERIEHLHFSRRRPSSVKVGDILIAHGVGAKRILSVYEVTSSIQKVKRNKNPRFPWYVLGRNLTCDFGRKWDQYNVYTSSIRDESLKNNPNELITQRGISLGSLNFGNDKLRLNPDFARFILLRVKHLSATS